MDNQTWIVEIDESILKRVGDEGIESLPTWEALVYCLWIADYGMKNAGDLEVSRDWFPDFQVVAVSCAKALSLPKTLAAFKLPTAELEKRYDELFDSICEEIRNAHPH